MTTRTQHKMNRTLAASLSCGLALAATSLTGCAGTACSYLTAVHNQAPVTYRVRQTSQEAAIKFGCESGGGEGRRGG